MQQENFKVKRRSEAMFSDEYGCQFWRVLPWNASGSSDNGMALAVLPPNTRTIAHSHKEVEYFFITKGCGIFFTDENKTSFKEGELICVSPYVTHYFENTSTSSSVEILCIWSLVEL